MIGRLRGLLAWKQPPYLLIDAHGVGYELEASLTTFQTLPEVGAEVALFTHLAVREDAHTLYGFASTDERALFRNLIKATGIGPRLALLILSGMSVDLFVRCVREGDTLSLTRLPGIGKKTAERLIIEMRDRIGELALNPMAVTAMGGRVPRTETSPTEDAISALVALGYKLPEASRMVQAIEADGLSSETIIRQALQASVRR
ncbi:MAG: Holliday junction branch migration protein RuvA [Candidatus Competibacteraceae bacterium]|nr:Holliday junction branch migration protein RuvA [Candidatus Competibacteraceae bacterium]MBK9952408.1 Holliday junction branch migration protein RuvA [Candidatus Competibacteraceae bacterium]